MVLDEHKTHQNDDDDIDAINFTLEMNFGPGSMAQPNNDSIISRNPEINRKRSRYGSFHAKKENNIQPF